ncbi:MAG: MBL fold metallo-hydrolase [Halanaeroarchaeum sp.]
MDVDWLTEGAEVFTGNAYLLHGDRTTLVDPGAMEGISTLLEERTRELDAVVLTHQHPDHVAELDAIVEAFSPAVYAFDEHRLRTEALADGDTVRMGEDRFDVRHTPGHADDHVVLVSERTLFSGDVVVYEDGAFSDGSFGRTDMAGQSRETLIRSIEGLLDALPPSVESLYAGHGAPYHGDVRSVVERALKRAKRLEPKYPDD